jgi:dipeptidase E
VRLYLSSFRLGDHPERFVSMVTGERRVAVICNAIDNEEPVRRLKADQELQWLTELGLTASGLDLRDYFDTAPERLGAELAAYDAVWVRGGNVFMLRHALARSGADKLLVDLLHRDALVYAGYSAGPCVLAASLRGLELCDDASVVPAIYGEPVIWDGLGVLDHAFLPHLNSPGHPETELMERVLAHYIATGVPHVTLRDGQALVIDGDSRELI